MAITDSEYLLKVIKKSQLLNSSQLEEVRGMISNFPKSEDLLKHLTRKKYFTRWQAGQLMMGRTSFVLGKYKLIDLLGSGGMGRVFRAEHTTMNRHVALKIISKELVSDPVAQKRFLDEARAIAALNHPNIVHAYSIDKEGGRYYIVMEYVEGRDLEQVVREDGIPEQEFSVKLIIQIASALDHAHEYGMVHCDIKPSNLILNNAGQIKVLDMGLARLYGKKMKEQVTQLNPEADSLLMGTIDYMAPEVANDGSSVSPRSDLYSLGCVFYFLLTGRIPFPGESIPERILKHQTETPVSPSLLNPRISQELSEICQKMMARKPEDRYVSANEVRQVLIDWLTVQEDTSESHLNLELFAAITESSSSSSKSGARQNKNTGTPSLQKGTKNSEEDTFELSLFLDKETEGSASPDTGIHLPGFPGFEEKPHFSSVDTSKNRTPVSLKKSADSGTITKSFHHSDAHIPQEKKKPQRISDSTAVLETSTPVQPLLKDSRGEDLEILEITPAKADTKKTEVSAKKSEKIKSKGTPKKRALPLNDTNSPQSFSSQDISQKTSTVKVLSSEGKNEKTDSSVKQNTKSTKKKAVPITSSSKDSDSLQKANIKKTSEDEGNVKSSPKKSSLFIRSPRIKYAIIGGGIFVVLSLIILAFIFLIPGQTDSSTSTDSDVLAQNNIPQTSAETTDSQDANTSEEKEEETDNSLNSIFTLPSKDKTKKSEKENISEKSEEAGTEETENKEEVHEETAPAPEEDSSKIETQDMKVPEEEKAAEESVSPKTPELSGTEKISEEIPKETPEKSTDKTPETEKKETAPAAVKKDPPKPVKKAASNPFSSFPAEIDLPEADTSDPFSLGTVDSGEEPLSISLLGTETAFPSAASSGKKGTQNIYTFTEKDGEWEISLPGKSNSVQHIATIKRDGNTLNFQWMEGDAKQKNPLRNCLLKLECNEKSHYTALRTPITLPTISFNIMNAGKSTQKPYIPEYPFPSDSILFVEITRVGQMDPKKDKFLHLPPPTCLNEISSKKPLPISFAYTDEASNENDVFHLLLNLSLSGNKLMRNISFNSRAVTIKDLASAFRMASDARYELDIKKLQKAANHKERSPQKSAAMFKMWVYNISQQISECDVQYRIYMELDGQKIDLIRTDPAAEDSAPNAKSRRKN
ncbi:MAG: protein kinase [Planctomycetia bacterium]|nr:protein kinase [Planctomycetia bacterium]